MSDNSSDSNIELSSVTKTTLQFVGIGLFVAILLFFIVIYIRDSISSRRQLTATAADARTAIPPRRNTGLDPDDISLLPKFIYRPSKKIIQTEKHHDHKGKKLTLFAECAVCISELEEGDIVRVLPTCKHFFHVQCIDKWLCTHSSCPMCRAHPEPDKVKLGVISASPPLPQLRRCGTMSERKESFSLSSCLGSSFGKSLSRGGSPYLHGSISLQGSPCLFTSPRVLPQETRIEVRVLDDSEIRQITEQFS